MDTVDIDGKIAELQNEIRKLNAEKTRLENLTPQQQIAEYMHKKLCHHDHAEYCSWYYEKDWKDSEHSRYLRKANALYTDFMFTYVDYTPSEKVLKLKDFIDIIAEH